MKKNKNTMLTTGAESEAYGMELLSYPDLKPYEIIPKRDNTGNKYDGVEGTNSLGLILSFCYTFADLFTERYML